MHNWGMDGNNSIINKRERLILILPFLTGLGAAFTSRPVFCCYQRCFLPAKRPWFLRKQPQEAIINMI